MARLTLSERLDALDSRLTAALADALHPFATKHRYELAGRLQRLETDLVVRVHSLELRCRDLELRLSSVERRIGDDMDRGDAWKWGST